MKRMFVLGVLNAGEALTISARSAAIAVTKKYPGYQAARVKAAIQVIYDESR